MDILFINMYNPPSKSPIYQNRNNCALNDLENVLCQDIDNLSRYDILLSGDLNARTGTAEDYVIVDERIHEFSHYDDLFSNDIATIRCSKDSIVNTFGRVLLNMCISYSMCILNGRVGNDTDVGEYTYHGHSGSSVIDYFICSSDMFYICENIKVDISPESDHMPVVLLLGTLDLGDNSKEDNPVNTDKIKLNTSNCHIYQEVLQKKHTKWGI